LRASHIKPWRKSSDVEKIDGDNGLMLAPHVDFLFDRGLISFEDDGRLIVSTQIEDGALESWGIPSEVNVGRFSTEQAVYLKFHREHELRG
jgi:predicted restriction endonuclease